jgi:hypothetical protein
MSKKFGFEPPICSYKQRERYKVQGAGHKANPTLNLYFSYA